MQPGAAVELAGRFGLPWNTPRAMVGCMATVPLPAAFGSGRDDAQRLRDWLLFERHIEVPVIARAGALWVRVCAQVYNDADDIAALARALEEAPR